MATSDRQAKPRFALIPAIATAIGIIILIGLGVWQIQRLHWKENLLARIAALHDAPPEPLEVVLRRVPDGVDIDYVRVQASCPDIETSPYLKLYTVWDAYAGYRVITACAISNAPYHTVLVDRGFLAQGLNVSPGQTLSDMVVGVMRKGDKGNFVTPKNDPTQDLWYSRDIPAMAAALHASDPAPSFLMLEQPAPKGGQPVLAPIPTDIPNNHLQYAITWFGLALALAGVYAASLFSKRRR